MGAPRQIAGGLLAMGQQWRLRPKAIVILVVTASITLVAATFVAWLLETAVGVPDASAVYLVAVVITAVVGGTPGAITSSVGSFLLYNYFFTEPRGTFAIDDAGVWLRRPGG